MAKMLKNLIKWSMSQTLRVHADKVLVSLQIPEWPIPLTLVAFNFG